MTWRIGITERAEADREAAFLWLLRADGDFATRWLEGLAGAIGGLAGFPGPRAYPLAPEADAYQQPVRRMLYYGPGNRRSGTPYRILFVVFEPESSEENEGAVQIVRILHGAARPLDAEDENSAT